MFDIREARIAVVGLGYVGLPLAVEFGKRYPTIGLDNKAERIRELAGGEDCTREVESAEIAMARHLQFTDRPEQAAHCNVYIITVPTPIDRYKRPDLSYLETASTMVGGLLSPGDIVIYESTVYPGATEEVCVPAIEAASGFTFNEDFFVGYSPERINPGDKVHTVTKVRKVTSGSTPTAAEFVDALYRSIIAAGTFRASSIRAAEASKVIENTQRDLNIALINELALIFNRLGIDTEEVLEAAGTKWNFLPFRPGLVGGHCIGVDPYYLTHKAQEIGYHPEVILAGRRINDNMGIYVAGQIIRLMMIRKLQVADSRILVLGLTFKENCSDLRNTRVIDLVAELRIYNACIDVHDPWVDAGEAKSEYGIDLVASPKQGEYDAVVIAVAHDIFREKGAEGLRGYCKAGGILYDVKFLLPANAVDGRL
jgi:UDP-N-acetyl-D-galactosamine dehydrogenase